jgi:hypothetical protein
MPISPWFGSKSYTYTQNQTLPTIAGIDETSLIESTRGTRRQLTVKLAQRGGQIENPVFLNSTMGSDFDQQLETIKDLVRAYAIDVENLYINGSYNDSVTISSGAGTKGIDGAVAGPRIDPSLGTGALSFDDTADTLAFRAPGDSDYGTAVDVSTDGTYTLYSANTSLWVSITIDFSDSDAGGDWAYTDALTFAANNEPDGLFKLVQPDKRWFGNGSATAGSTNGDAISLEILDLMLDELSGPPEEQAFVVKTRTRRALKTLMRGLSNVTVDNVMGVKLARPMLAYEGRPIFVSDRIPATETVDATTDCTSLFGVRLSREKGVHMLYGAQMARGATWQAQSASADIQKTGSTVLPMYLRALQERDDYATVPVRLTSSLAVACMESAALVEIHGITN